MTGAISRHFKGKVTNSILNMMGLWCQWPLGKTPRWRSQAVRWKCRSGFLKRSWCQEREMQKSKQVYFELINSPNPNNQGFKWIKLLWRLCFFQCAVIFSHIFVVPSELVFGLIRTSIVFPVWPGLESMFSRKPVLGQFSSPICKPRSSDLLSKL